MSDKYISVTELKKKLNYIFRANGVSTCTKEAINGAIKRLPFVFKGELETTLETSAELEIKREAVRVFAEKLKARFAKLEYKTDTHRKTCSINRLDTTVNWVINEVTSMEIDNLVSEMFGNPESVKCKDCKHLMYSDCYGECSQGYKGIVQPDDSCKYGERKLK